MQFHPAIDTAAFAALERARQVLHMHALPMAVETARAEAESEIREALRRINEIQAAVSAGVQA